MQLKLVLFIFLYALQANIHAAPSVVFETSQGNFTVELYPEKAPKTVANFLQYVKDGFYENTIFHRVMNNFMIQGGGFERDLTEKNTRAPIINESNNGLLNEPGTIAMARTMDPDSATAQFFVNLIDNQFFIGILYRSQRGDICVKFIFKHLFSIIICFKIKTNIFKLQIYKWEQSLNNRSKFILKNIKLLIY
jgi:cyclophilin family peptidyl-prolyl cis-trans isomerase